jgi:hypothetical protein
MRRSLHNNPENACRFAPGYRSFGWPLGEAAGSLLSAGFCVSVGWPVTSPGREDIPGSRLVPLLSSVVLGLAGRATLPDELVSVEGLTLPRVSVAEPEVAEPVLDEPVLDVPELVDPVPDVPLAPCGAEGEAGLVFVSSADGVSDGEVFARCMLLSPLRPCELRLLFLIFLSFDDELGTDSVELPAAASPLFTLPELSLPTPVETEAPPRLGTALDDVSRFELLSGCA